MIAQNIHSPEQGAEKSRLLPFEKPAAAAPITDKADNAIYQNVLRSQALVGFTLTECRIDVADGTAVGEKRELEGKQITRTTGEKVQDFLRAASRRAADGDGWKAWAQGELNKFAGIGSGLNEAKDETKAAVAAGWKAMTDGTVIDFLSQPNAINKPVFKAVATGFEAIAKDPEATNRTLAEIVTKASHDYSKLPDSEKGKVIGKVMFGMVNPEGSTKAAEATLKVVDQVATHVDSAVMKTVEQAVKTAEQAAKASPEVAQETKRMLLDYLQSKGLRHQEYEYAGIPKGFFDGVKESNAAGLQDNILRMQSATPVDSGSSIEQLKAKIENVSAKPIADSFGTVIGVNSDLLNLSKLPVTSRNQADALATLEDKFIDHMKTIRNDVTTLKPQAEAIEAKAAASAAEEKLVEKYYAAEDTLYQVVTDRLKTLYGWNEVSPMKDTGIYMSSGMGTQRRISNAISDMFNHGLDKNPYIQSVLETNGVSEARAKDWVGIPMPGSSGADHAGCDYLLANKATGEIYTLDVTERAIRMKSGNLLESRLTNPELGFWDKDIPVERKHLVIGVADDMTKDNLVFRQSRALKISRDAAEKLVNEQEQKQLAGIIAQTISRPSELNIFDTQLPSARSAIPPNPEIPVSRQAYELWRFKTGVEKKGYADWAKSIKRSIGYVKSKNPGLPDYE